MPKSARAWHPGPHPTWPIDNFAPSQVSLYCSFGSRVVPATDSRARRPARAGPCGAGLHARLCADKQGRTMELQAVLPAVGDWSFPWAAYAIALTCFSLLVFVVLLLAKYVRICINIFVASPMPLSMGPLDFQPIHGEVVRFRSFDGTSLRGMHLNTPNRAAYKGTIVFCHEFGSDMYSCARYARPLIESGFDVFTFDFRGHGQSSRGR